MIGRVFDAFSDPLARLVGYVPTGQVSTEIPVTNEQIHKLSATISQQESAERDVTVAEQKLEAAKANRDRLAAKVEQLRGGVSAAPQDTSPKALGKKLDAAIPNEFRADPKPNDVK